VKWPAAHSHKADVQRQPELERVRAPTVDGISFRRSEGEERLQLEVGQLARQFVQSQVRRSPGLHGCLPASRRRCGPGFYQNASWNPCEINNLSA
jgi:hypothetical protein